MQRFDEAGAEEEEQQQKLAEWSLQRSAGPVRQRKLAVVEKVKAEPDARGVLAEKATLPARAADGMMPRNAATDRQSSGCRVRNKQLGYIFLVIMITLRRMHA